MMPRLTSRLTQIRNISTIPLDKNSEIYKELEKFATEVFQLFKEAEFEKVVNKIDKSKFNDHPDFLMLRELADDRQKYEHEVLKKSGWFTTSENIEAPKTSESAK